ncbi:hypothetical protein R1flu_013252 [Riccia fluitans]|uniref:Uncharacterized protein n=1 Tax=Riccia fluitans TaxID=41844 RepID=A0ABD1YD24_9MARC
MKGEKLLMMIGEAGSQRLQSYGYASLSKDSTYRCRLFRLNLQMIVIENRLAHLSVSNADHCWLLMELFFSSILAGLELELLLNHASACSILSVTRGYSRCMLDAGAAPASSLARLGLKGAPSPVVLILVHLEKVVTVSYDE